MDWWGGYRVAAAGSTRIPSVSFRCLTLGVGGMSFSGIRSFARGASGVKPP